MNEIAKVMRAFQIIALPLAVLALLGNQYLQSFGPTIHRFGAYAMLVLALSVMAWTGYRVNRIRWKVKRENYLLCMNCLYSLKGLEPSGKCPECGTPYNVEILRKEWISNLKKAPF